ncbi:MAG TPA: hypothetical protein VFW71_03020 [Actinomycetota bacterium]|nr:hypothetical protein [Actinomycetota bacterium]
MTARRFVAAAGVALVVLSPLALVTVPASAAPARAARAPAAGARAPVPAHVVIVSMPGVTWRDVMAGSAPTLRRLAQGGAVGALSVRVVDTPTDLASAFATIGAGNRARGGGPATGRIQPNAGPLPGGGLLVSQWGAVVADNARLHFGAVPGALGSALHRAGLKTAVVGNEDEVIAGVRTPERSAALALADASGRVDIGDVGEDMSPGTALAGQEDPAAIATATVTALGSAQVVLVDLAETRRVGDALAKTAPPGGNVSYPARTAALERDDQALAAVLARVDLHTDTVVVLAPAGMGAGWPDTLTVAAEAGVGVTPGGWLTSATTHRDGLVTLPDVAPGILSQLHLAVPTSMTGSVLHSVAAGGVDRMAVLVGLQESSTAYRNRIAPFIVVLSLLGVAVFAAGVVAMGRGRGRGRPFPPALRMAVVLGGLAVGAAPVGALVQAALGAERWGGPGAALVLVAADLVVVAVALAGPWRSRRAGPAAFVAILTLAVIAGDLLTGSHGQLVSLMGYSPIEAGRFYGLSPLSFAILASEVLVVAGVAAAARSRPAVIALLIGAVVVGLAGAPMLGAKFGAILSLVPAFGLLALLVTRRRLPAGRSAVLGAAAVLAAGVVALGIGILDSLRPAQSQTHIGRFVRALFGGGPGGVKDVILRKADANLGVYVHVPVALVIPAALALVGVALLQPPAWLAARLEAIPGLRAGLLAAAAANVLGLAVNDSGVAIPAMGLAVGIPLLVALLVRVEPAPE